MSWGWNWRPYVSVAQRRAKAAKAMDRLRKKGVNIRPVKISGRTIAHSFWGRAWCDHLEKFSDFENRLPRGRTYVRNGSVCHLAIQKGKIEAKVSGSEIYNVKITIKTLPPAKWKSLKARCAGGVGSMLELLQGKLSENVMGIVTDRDNGLFPLPREIALDCSCPDWATMCKHVAAVLYGVGARLDEQPELLFLLRAVDHRELVSEDAAKAVVAKGTTTERMLDEKDLSGVFGIDLGEGASAKAGKTAKKRARTTQEPPKPAAANVRPVKPRRSRKGKDNAAQADGEALASEHSPEVPAEAAATNQPALTKNRVASAKQTNGKAATRRRRKQAAA